MRTLPVKIPDDLQTLIDAEVERRRREAQPGKRVTRSDVVRELMALGLQYAGELRARAA